MVKNYSSIESFGSINSGSRFKPLQPNGPSLASKHIESFHFSPSESMVPLQVYSNIDASNNLSQCDEEQLLRPSPFCYGQTCDNMENILYDDIPYLTLDSNSSCNDSQKNFELDYLDYTCTYPELRRCMSSPLLGFSNCDSTYFFSSFCSPPFPSSPSSSPPPVSYPCPSTINNSQNEALKSIKDTSCHYSRLRSTKSSLNLSNNQVSKSVKITSSNKLHRRTKNITSTLRRKKQPDSSGFVNYYPRDGQSIMSAVAPSGSGKKSKRKKVLDN